MPRLSQWIIRAALIYLLLGVTIGALLLAHKGVAFYPGLWSWLPAHIEFLFMGWVVHLTMSVGFWILPRFWKPPRRPRAGYVWAAFVLLNVGIWLVVWGSTLGGGRWLLLTGRTAEAAAVLLFGLHAWRRIVGREGAG